jgi:5-methylthioadenosine/S-adenosylhomocysteine deaminase
VAETLDEVAILHEREGMTPIEYLDSLGLLTPRTVAVHCVHITDSDIAIMKKRGVSAVHNPQSNMKLASGIAPVAQMKAAGVNVAIGTDGASSNNDLDMWEEMRSASFLQKVTTGDTLALPAWEILRMATVGGAKALRLDDRVGTIAEGMLADVILVDMRKPHLQPVHDPISNLAYCAGSADVSMTVVDGRIVAENGRCTTLDADDVMRRARKYTKKPNIS